MPVARQEYLGLCVLWSLSLSLQSVPRRKKMALYVYEEEQEELMFRLLWLLLFLTFSALVANPKKLLYTVANLARGLLNREKKKKKKVWQRSPPPGAA